jgi:hypothetical protein
MHGDREGQRDEHKAPAHELQAVRARRSVSARCRAHDRSDEKCSDRCVDENQTMRISRSVRQLTSPSDGRLVGLPTRLGLAIRLDQRPIRKQYSFEGYTLADAS